MIDSESSDRHAVVLVDRTFTDNVHVDLCAFRLKFLDEIAADMDVFGVEFQQTIHHLLRAARTVELQRLLAAHDPTRVEQIGQSACVIRM